MNVWPILIYLLGLATGGFGVYWWWQKYRLKPLQQGIEGLEEKAKELYQNIQVYQSILKDLKAETDQIAKESVARLVPYERLALSECTQLLLIRAAQIKEGTVIVEGLNESMQKWLEGKSVYEASQPDSVFDDALYGEKFYTIKDDQLYMVLRFVFPLPERVHQI